MALDLSGFTSEQQTFGGLYKLGDNLERDRMRKEQTQQKDSANNLMKSKFLENYLDPKEFLTGTINDPYVTDRLNSILQKGSALANEKGVDTNMMQMALSSDVNKLMKETQNIKEIERQRKESFDFLKGKKGIDPQRYNEYFKKSAYYNADGTLKDLSDIDPTKNYADETLRSGDIYTPESIDEFVKGAGKNTYSTRLKVQNGRGGFEDKSVSVTAPAFMIPDKDAAGNHVGFVPEYEVATSDGQPVLHDFLGDKGEKVKAPVRMVTKDVYASLPVESKAYLRQEAIKYAKQHGIEPSSPEVDNFQRALAYDEIKRSEKQTSNFVQKEIQRDNTIKIFAPRQPRQASDSQLATEESINNLHKTLNDTQPDSKGDLDVSQLLNGIKLLNKYNDQIVLKSGSYNPKTKEFTIQTDKGEETMPYHRLATLAATANPGTDMKWLKGFKTYERAADANNKPPEKKKATPLQKVADIFKNIYSPNSKPIALLVFAHKDYYQIQRSHFQIFYY